MQQLKRIAKENPQLVAGLKHVGRRIADKAKTVLKKKAMDKLNSISFMSDAPPGAPQQSMNAPTSFYRPTMPSFAMRAGSTVGGCIIKFRLPICTLANQTTAVFGTYKGIVGQVTYTMGGTTNTTAATTLFLNPAIILACSISGTGTTFGNGLMIPDSLALNYLAAAFSRYRLKGRIVISYIPYSVSTTTTDAFGMAFTSDPYHGILGSRAYNMTTPGTFSNAPPNFVNLKQSPNFLAFPAWAPISRSYEVDNSQWFYTYTPPSMSATFNSGNPITDEARQSFFGALNVCSPNSGSNLVAGELYLSGEIEFAEFMPMAANRIILPTLLSLSPVKYKVDNDHKESKEPVETPSIRHNVSLLNVDDDIVTVSPQATPLHRGSHAKSTSSRAKA